MKRLTAIFLTAACALSLTACGAKKPSMDEVEKAIQEGDLTMEDALAKGWITQEWVDEYIAENSVPASNKMESGAVGEFTTTTLSGEEFTKEQLGDVCLFVFVDPADAEAEGFVSGLSQGYDGVKENGAEIIVCAKNEENPEIFADVPFPVINYNDSLKDATKNHKGMIEDLPNAASWYVNGAFLSAWYSTIEAEDIVESAAAFVEMQKEMGNGAGEEGAEGTAAAVMG